MLIYNSQNALSWAKAYPPADSNVDDLFEKLYGQDRLLVIVQTPLINSPLAEGEGQGKG